jgi:hypothetical protein
MSRTNKQGIASKKAQLQKQASRTKGQKKREYPNRKVSLDDAKEYGFIGVQTNPRGNSYNWFLRGRKVCRETRLRVDPDGYRFTKLPSGGSDFVMVHMGGWLRRRMQKAMAQKSS